MIEIQNPKQYVVNFVEKIESVYIRMNIDYLSLSLGEEFIPL